MPIHQVRAALAALAVRRPVFHSEADFQHAFAWELQQRQPGARIRLEKQVAAQGARMHLDLLVQSPGGEIAIELKYKTRLAALTHAGEHYALRTHGAQDTGRHDFIKDIQRLEAYVRTHAGAAGAAIFLTNDRTYWLPAAKNDSIDAAFHLHEGRVLHGSMTWGPHASAGSKEKRTAPIVLQGRYAVRWSDYAVPGQGDNAQFRYVLLGIS